MVPLGLMEFVCQTHTWLVYGHLLLLAILLDLQEFSGQQSCLQHYYACLPACQEVTQCLWV